MYDRILSEKENLKLLILKEMLYNPTSRYTSKLSKIFNRANSSIIRYLNEIMSDLEYIFSQKLIIDDHDGSYTIINKDNSNFSYILDMLKHYYLSNSDLYELYFTLLLGREIYSTEQLAQHLNMSISSTYSKLKRINLIAAPFGVKVKISKKKFIGEEVNIRVFIGYMTWVLLRGVKNESLPHFYNPWNDKSYIDNLPFKSYENLSNSQLNKLKILLNTLVYRTKVEGELIELPHEFYEEAAPFAEIDHPFLDILSNYLDGESKKKETIFFYFVARTIYGIDTEIKKKEIIERLKGSSTEIMTIIIDFLEAFRSYFDILFTQESYDEVLYIVTISFLYYKYIGIDFTDNFEFSIFEINKEFNNRRKFTSKLREINFFLDKYLENHKILYMTHNMKELLSHSLYFILETSYFNCKLNIYIDYSKNLWIPNSIKHNILSSFNNDSVQFVEDFAEADIVISDIYTKNITNLNNTFYFENPYLDQTWSELLKFVANSIYQKKHQVLRN